MAQWVGALLRVSFRDSVAGVRYPGLPTVESSSGLKLLPCVGASGCVSQPAGKFAKANKHYRLLTHTIQSQIQHSLYANHTLHSPLSVTCHVVWSRELRDMGYRG